MIQLDLDYSIHMENSFFSV